MKKSIKLVMAMFAIMLVSVTNVFAYDISDLGIAASTGDLNTVKKCVKAGVDVNGRQTSGKNVGWTPLTLAAYYGYTTIAKYLIANGASVDRPIKDTKGNSAPPIYYAAREGKLECVKILIYNDADPNIKHNNKNKNALEIAQDEGFTNIVKFLKEHGGR